MESTYNRTHFREQESGMIGKVVGVSASPLLTIRVNESSQITEHVYVRICMHTYTYSTYDVCTMLALEKGNLSRIDMPKPRNIHSSNDQCTDRHAFV